MLHLRIMDKRKFNGGAREGAGRKPRKDKKKGYNVYLRDKQKKHLVKTHHSLTDAIVTLLPENLKD